MPELRPSTRYVGRSRRAIKRNTVQPYNYRVISVSAFPYVEVLFAALIMIFAPDAGGPFFFSLHIVQLVCQPSQCHELLEMSA